MYYALVTISSNNKEEDIWELTDNPREALREFKNHNPNIKAYTRKATKIETQEYLTLMID